MGIREACKRPGMRCHELHEWGDRWWRENLQDFSGRFAVIFPIDAQHLTFVANAPVEHLQRHGLPFKADTSRCAATFPLAALSWPLCPLLWVSCKVLECCLHFNRSLCSKCTSLHLCTGYRHGFIAAGVAG